MVKLTVEQDMKLGSALDQLEDAIEAAHTSLKMANFIEDHNHKILDVITAYDGTVDAGRKN
jgi:hypothetical protein